MVVSISSRGEVPVEPMGVQWPTPNGVTCSSAQSIAPADSETLAVSPPSQVSSGGQLRILVVTGGMGGGHKSPMDAIVDHLRTLEGVTLTYESAVKVTPFQRGWMDHAKYQVTRTSWGAKFANSYRKHVTQKPAYKAVNDIVQDELAKNGIDIAVTNHRILGQALADSLPANVPMALQTTDHGKMHPGWYPKRLREKETVDALYVPGPTGQTHARRYGVQSMAIQKLGYGVRSAFEEARGQTKADLRKKLNLPIDKRVVVMSAGKGEWGDRFVALVTKLMNDPRSKDIYLVAIAGENRELHDKLSRIAGVDTRGWLEASDMAELVRASDINAIKAGGGAIGESYALRSVPVIFQRLSGVEHDNVKHVQKQGTGIVALEERKFIDAVFETTDEALVRMQDNQDKMETVGAASKIANDIFERARASRRRQSGG